MSRFQMNWLAFAGAFALGVAYIYVKSEKPVIVVRWPTPINAGKSVYTDATGDCFVYDAVKAECTADATAPKPAEKPEQLDDSVPPAIA
jgi:hypothetical protein